MEVNKIHTKEPSISAWIWIGLLNLCIVATLGVIMRYKICCFLPSLNQKFLQEAHSHFAFAGWITHTLFCLLVVLFRQHLSPFREKRYHILITLNLLSAYGMLIAFAVQGYGPVSLFFSTISLFTGYVFFFYAYKDAHRLGSHHPARNWIKAAAVFGFLSTVGTMILSRMMILKEYDQEMYLGSVFLYLHFQYNGWFFFACGGLFMNSIRLPIAGDWRARAVFWSFFLAVIPAYLLSLLWANLPAWLYALVVVSAWLQIIGWYFFIQLLRKHHNAIKSIFSRAVVLLFLIVALALSVKLLLQLASVIPAVHKLAFGFRPIVIAYLHLILLLIVTVFLLTYLYSIGYIKPGRKTGWILGLFAGGVIANEIVLATQGILAIQYQVLPYMKQTLLGISIWIWIGACLLLIHQRISSRN